MQKLKVKSEKARHLLLIEAKAHNRFKHQATSLGITMKDLHDKLSRLPVSVIRKILK